MFITPPLSTSCSFDPAGGGGTSHVTRVMLWTDNTLLSLLLPHVVAHIASSLSLTLHHLLTYSVALVLKRLYRPSDRRLSAKLVPTSADRRCHVVSVTDPYGRILGFLDQHITSWLTLSLNVSPFIYFSLLYTISIFPRLHFYFLRNEFV
jgi:hypothetical protein